MKMHGPIPFSRENRHLSRPLQAAMAVFRVSLLGNLGLVSPVKRP